MLAFHNEHIASCAFLTYFTPDSTTASTSPTALTTTAATASILNDKQALTGILYKAKRKRPYMCTMPANSLHYWLQRTKRNLNDSFTFTTGDVCHRHQDQHRRFKSSLCHGAELYRELSLNKTTINTTINYKKQHQCSSDNINKPSVFKL